ncbi:30S ribosomal protein S9 [Candidatus Daviesbacteria bacterium RIFCSPHIGHO2_01_FULL_44_29]|uniref:30S ribosomal protein S9 n=1 Tax=Candidatus Daviesbacteria bacterium RIFCSPHIGHO2_02_FULL_43_12 TaxID=1797776 RepID=A0A1F5KGI7_9BACT|nr:MAG: 30S ribosomal protein S9 [Candidatus Daviesbacteria bacterium RIFCSPHIGHO2_01_FULL_44_29]OGE39930.1 MAG: 30S ribosomal protein S9 [Candidatus Daviesbacteria bacterium RIFCSPHIGHO2_02_FULL_43_12]OGE40512.1 MAG: 30S ribosomal protein S9 [Candidatus Daviesbacteria bacterium RIFCSPHIGHO2_12_FULL_47_45]OGE70389.1 MAG: 30S ribosomal protein S9 [Candidatus Daviesbacteria bacterium RIFCSPLOWO2_01_FULL_43_15]
MPTPVTNFSHAVGRRKEAVARVRILKGNGQLTVNGKPISEYFRGPLLQKLYQRPFEVTATLGQYTGTIKVEGGGFAAQVGAIVHGLARALEQVDKEKYRPSLKSAGLLTRDPRAKERRKFGQAGKARAKKQSPKR